MKLQISLGFKGFCEYEFTNLVEPWTMQGLGARTPQGVKNLPVTLPSISPFGHPYPHPPGQPTKDRQVLGYALTENHVSTDPSRSKSCNSRAKCNFKMAVRLCILPSPQVSMDHWYPSENLLQVTCAELFHHPRLWPMRACLPVNMFSMGWATESQSAHVINPLIRPPIQLSPCGQLLKLMC